jgi:pyruvate kinase
MRERGLKNVMISFAESPADADEVRDLLPGAVVVQKIESLRGLDYIRTEQARHGRLMAARGDLYVEVARPHQILPALKDIIRADPNAIVASRILDSLAYTPIPDSADLGDLGFLLEIGYRTFMLGDQVCLKRDSVIEALNLLDESSKDFSLWSK